MPNTARWAVTGTLITAAVCGPLSGTALATPTPAPASLYAPSALVLTVGRGVTAASATPERAVTLTCTPAASGTHPAAVLACDELAQAGGDLDALRGTDRGMCTRQYDPVVVTVDGVWRGKRVAYERTFGNACVKDAQGTALFAF
jgi:hypothetical protein